MEFHDNHRPTPPRETMLTLLLTALGAGAFLVFLILISGGFFFYVVLAAAAITGLGFFHYLLWGYAMTRDVTAERDLTAEAERESDLLGEQMRRRRV